MIESIRARLAVYPPHEIAWDGRRAAVLIPLYVQDGELHVVLTRRTDTLGRHAGEVSFPGGGWEPADADLAATALRESDEEIGLCPDDVEIIGRVDDIITVSDFHVTVYVGHIDPATLPCVWRPQELEVAAVLEVPLSHLLDAANHVEVPRTRANGEFAILQGIRFGDHVIWGATERMLRNFLEVAVLPVATAEAAGG